MATSVGIKGLTLLSQLVLAWFLVPAEFGLAATAVSITAMTDICRTGGLHVTLVRTQRGWLRLGGQAFYLALIVNALICIAVCAAAIPISQHYREPRLVPLLWIASLSFPMEQFGLVESAWMVRNMKFQRLTLINLAQSLVRTLGQIGLAYAGWGALSLILPNFPALLLRVVATRASAPRMPFQRPRPATWLPLWKDTLKLNLSSFTNVIGQQGSTLVVSLMLTASATGLFFWGTSLASQAVYLLGGALAGVFLPVFASVNSDAERQRQAFLKSAEAITQLVAPVCFVQLLVGGDLFALLLRPEWHPAWPIFAVTSFAVLLQPLVVILRSLLQAQGRFNRLIVVNAAMAIFPLAAVIAVAQSGNVNIVTIANALGLMIGSAVVTVIGLQPSHVSPANAVQLIAKPHLMAALPAALTYLLQIQLDQPVLRIIFAVTFYSLCYGLAMRAWGGRGYQVLADRFARLIGRSNSAVSSASTGKSIP